MSPPGLKITTEILWSGTLLFAAIDAVFVPLLAWRIRRTTFRSFRWSLVTATAVFWGSLWVVVIATFWDPVYHYVFPAWAHWLIPPAYALLFAGISLLFWWLALRLGGNPVLNFCLLGGLWGAITHLLAVSLGIVTKPPVLQGAAPVAAVVIAIFEFIFYWCLILCLAVLFQRAWRLLSRVLHK